VSSRPTPSFVGLSTGSLLVPAGRWRNVASSAALVLTLVASGAGLFLDEPPIRVGTDMGVGDLVRLLAVVVLLGGLAHSAVRYAAKQHTFLDELSLLVFLVCGVNLVVQLTGGSRSYWQGLYLVLGGLASVAFSRRLVVVMVAAVLAVEVANWTVQPGTSLVDLSRLALLFLLAVIGFNFMERAERERAERAEDRLLRLNAGLQQLSGPEEDEAISPLSEDGQRASRAEQLQKLDSHLAPLLGLVRKATGADDAVLLQVDADEGSFWVRLHSSPERAPSVRRFPLRGSIFSEVLKSDRDVVVEGFRDMDGPPWLPKDEPVPSVCSVPIRIWDEPPWILALHHRAPGFFDEERRELARAVAQQMKEAQTLFRRQAQKSVEELELKGLLRASEKLSGTTRLAELLNHMVDYARDVSKFDTCAICLREDGKDQFLVAVADGYRKEIVGNHFPLEAPTWAGWVLRAREEPLAIRMERRSGMPILDPKERTLPGASFLAVPLKAQNRISGTLLLTRQGEPFTSRELRLLRIYCNQAAVALENAIVYERVENLAATDALTGLFNRRYFEGSLAQELARCDRTSSRLALLVIDIDHFKSFNDTYGHVMGDLVLRKVALTLQGALRKADVLARFGGEEFVVILPQVTLKGAMESAERLRDSVARSAVHPGGPRKKVTVSIGVALFPDQASNGDELLRAADGALYQAKHLGRNRVEIHRVEAADSTSESETRPDL
jgi:diguanylate cyclase (GGDEF)-like protein